MAQGVVEAMVALADLHLDIASPELLDFDAAEAWYTKASERGDARAKAQLGALRRLMRDSTLGLKLLGEKGSPMLDQMLRQVWRAWKGSEPPVFGDKWREAALAYASMAKPLFGGRSLPY